VHVRLDPIINSAVAMTSQHVHTVMGARTFGPLVNNDTDFDPAQGTTCNVAHEHVLWSPSMYYKDGRDATGIVKNTLLCRQGRRILEER
jgi:hypothetical protein